MLTGRFSVASAALFASAYHSPPTLLYIDSSTARRCGDSIIAAHLAPGGRRHCAATIIKLAPSVGDGCEI